MDPHMVPGLDFTSAAYLGLRHGPDRIGRWRAIAGSRPAALHEPCVIQRAGHGVARLQGEEDGVCGPSSLVLAMDALGPAAPAGTRVLVDAGCYPTLLWAAAQRGMPLQVAHQDPASLSRVLATLPPAARPILAVDGFCVGCGRAAPLAAFAGLLARRSGLVLVDDTQALGVMGPSGGGTRAKGAPPGSVLRLVSLSKAFNAPLAVLSGSATSIAEFRRRSASRMLCGPPAIPVALAALHALTLNASIGGRLRAVLRARVLTFRKACAAFGVLLAPGLFPVQTVLSDADPSALVAHLAARGLRAFASLGFHDRCSRARLIITGAHAPETLWTAAAHLADALGRISHPNLEPRHATL
jgi:8-amino-7-oxononanoate synthase